MPRQVVRVGERGSELGMRPRTERTNHSQKGSALGIPGVEISEWQTGRSFV